MPLVDTSNSGYAAKGWMLTGTSCSVCSCPLMRRSTESASEFCAACNGGPCGASDHPTGNLTLSSRSASSSSRISHESAAGDKHRPDTPPTELSSTLSSPTFAVPPVINPEVIRRREQSDRASSRIGERLLKGWAMLGEECPNATCYGVPLVRPPKPGGGRDPRKECVICETTYVTENDGSGYGHLVVAPTPESATTDPAVSSQNKGKAVARGVAPDASDSFLDPTVSPSSGHVSKLQATPSFLDTLLRSTSRPDVSSTSSPTLAALVKSCFSLEITLHALSERLRLLTDAKNLYALDATAIASTADAIDKVTQALGQVKRLIKSEGQVAGSAILAIE